MVKKSVVQTYALLFLFGISLGGLHFVYFGNFALSSPTGFSILDSGEGSDYSIGINDVEIFDSHLNVDFDLWHPRGLREGVVLYYGVVDSDGRSFIEEERVVSVDAFGTKDSFILDFPISRDYGENFKIVIYVIDEGKQIQDSYDVLTVSD